jgi:hypothetical protein
LCTGHSKKISEEKSAATGSDAFLIKPVSTSFPFQFSDHDGMDIADAMVQSLTWDIAG